MPHSACVQEFIIFVLSLQVIYGSDQPLRFRVAFNPLRILSTLVDLVITKESGGKWRFVLALEVRVNSNYEPWTGDASLGFVYFKAFRSCSSKIRNQFERCST